MEAALVASGVAVLGGAAFSLFRSFVSVPVNCWFCSENTVVKYAKRNSWTCRSCGQYNGFSPDGDYNREIPEQHVGSENGSAQYADVRNVNNEDVEVTNGLCRNCNLNQELKILQLKNFIPSHPDKDDSELKDFESLLERTYKLCRYCEAHLHQKLGEQDCWLKPKLLAWKLELNRQSPLSSAIRLQRQQSDLLQRWIVFLLSWIMFFGTITLPLFESHLSSMGYWTSICFSKIVSGFLVLILSLYGIKPFVVINYPCHQATVATWIALFTYSSFEKLAMEFTNLAGYEFWLRSFVTFLCVVASTFCHTSRSSSGKNIEKKSKHYTFNTRNYDKEFEEEDDTLTQDLLSTSSDSSSKESGKTNISQRSSLRPPLRPSLLGQMLENHEIYQGDHSDSLSFSCGFPEVVKEVNVPECDISTLYIGKSADSSHGLDRRSPLAFEVKQFDPLNTSGINFGPGDDTYSSGQPIIRKPRFIYHQNPSRPNAPSVAQTSWVAGGYWQINRGQTQNANETCLDRLSRSSSQTSGFISYSGENPFSNFTSLPNSRVNSVFGDRNSILSEPIFNTRREMSLQSLGNQLAFYDTSKKVDKSWGGSDSSSFNSSLGKMSPSILSSFKPNAESSPLDKKMESSSHQVMNEKPVSLLQREFQFSISMHTIILFMSVSVNVGVALYMVLSNL